MQTIFCAVCNLPITGDDYNNRHWGHEEGCPNRRRPDSVDCSCDLEYHAACCPDCNGATAQDEEPADCQSTSHDHSQCYGDLWQCDECRKWVCYADGTDDGTGDSLLCDACWAKAHPDHDLAAVRLLGLAQVAAGRAATREG